VDEIRNARDQVIGAGITFVQPQGLTASLRLRHFAEAPLTEDGSISHGDTTLVNAGLQYDFGSWRAGLEFLNLFDAQDDDIAYYFVSRLPGEAAPVEDIHFYPVMPFSLRASIRWELGGKAAVQFCSSPKNGNLLSSDHICSTKVATKRSAKRLKLKQGALCSWLRLSVKCAETQPAS